MKVSLKYKLPFFILLAFFLFILLLILYYRLFLMENLGKDFDVFKDHLYQISEEIAAKINDYYPDQQKITGYLEEVSARKNAKITVYDVDGNKITGADHWKGYGLSLELKNFTVVGPKVIYVVELVYPFSIENLGELNSFKKIRDAALVLLALLIILLMVYLHFSLVRPLTLLNRGLAAIDYRNTGFAIPARMDKKRDELGDLARKFEAMQQRLAASYRQQTEMVASISHDLKTPLTSIIGFLERLMSLKISEERQAEYHRIIDQKARDIQELLTEFNDFVTSDLEESNGSREVVNLKEFFEMISAEYTAELAGKGIDLRWIDESGTGGGFFLEIDTQKIRRVFANLVGNSLKYADKLSKLTFTCAVRKNQAIFSVEDDGPGVPSGELAAIFEKFYRVDKSRSREKGGSGLGLAICQRIIENYGGSIRAYLPNDGGLGISFSLPLKNIHKA
jgi:signal transduction histidine kinase